MSLSVALSVSLSEVPRWLLPLQVNLFSEEVVRGSAAFSVSLLCTRMDPALRQVAEMGAWQIISPGRSPVTGTVVVVPDLRDVQLEVYPPHTVMISNNVSPPAFPKRNSTNTNSQTKRNPYPKKKS
jgi:alpha-glucan,water dikinase